MNEAGHITGTVPLQRVKMLSFLITLINVEIIGYFDTLQIKVIS
jgi:hypothetical protein